MNNYTKILKQIVLSFKIERIKRRLSQEQFAEITNEPTNYVAKIERGE